MGEGQTEYKPNVKTCGSADGGNAVVVTPEDFSDYRRLFPALKQPNEFVVVRDKDGCTSVVPIQIIYDTYRQLRIEPPAIQQQQGQSPFPRAIVSLGRGGDTRIRYLVGEGGTLDNRRVDVRTGKITLVGERGLAVGQGSRQIISMPQGTIQEGAFVNPNIRVRGGRLRINSPITGPAIVDSDLRDAHIGNTTAENGIAAPRAREVVATGSFNRSLVYAPITIYGPVDINTLNALRQHQIWPTYAQQLMEDFRIQPYNRFDRLNHPILAGIAGGVVSDAALYLYGCLANTDLNLLTYFLAFLCGELVFTVLYLWSYRSR